MSWKTQLNSCILKSLRTSVWRRSWMLDKLLHKYLHVCSCTVKPHANCFLMHTVTWHRNTTTCISVPWKWLQSFLFWNQSEQGFATPTDINTHTHTHINFSICVCGAWDLTHTHAAYPNPPVHTDTPNDRNIRPHKQTHTFDTYL